MCNAKYIKGQNFISPTLPYDFIGVTAINIAKKQKASLTQYIIWQICVLFRSS
jgi:hypothetical protein